MTTLGRSGVTRKFDPKQLLGGIKYGRPENSAWDRQTQNGGGGEGGSLSAMLCYNLVYTPSRAKNKLKAILRPIGPEQSRPKGLIIDA